MLVLETSPGTEQAIGLVRPRVFQEDDRAGVVVFDRAAHLLQPLTGNRDRLADALQRAGFRVGVTVGEPHSGWLNSNFTVDLVAALKKSCSEFGERGSAERRRAIVVLFAGEDPSLGGQLDDLKVTLSAVDARLYAVVVQRIHGPEAAPIPRTARSPLPIPSSVVTARLMSQLTEESGGRIFKRNWDLKKILAEARKP